MTCDHCSVPLVTVRAMSGKPWQACPFSDCPGHGRVLEPCYGKMRCYDEMDYGDGDYVCFKACNGHLSQAVFDMTLSGISANPRPPYEPRSL